MKEKYKILIVEDEPIIATDLELTLEKIGYTVTDTVEDANSTMISIKKNKPDLILLDINIEGEIDGVMLAQDIKSQYNIPFVYLTSSTDIFTINRVKRTEPAGFIVKPFNEKDLLTNIEIGLFKANKSKTSTQHQNNFFVKDGNNFVKVELNDLIFIKADDSYSKIFTTKKVYVHSLNLGKLATKLPEDLFVRIHRSYVINIKYLDKITNGFVIIGKHKLPISKSYHDDFFKRINKL